MKFEKKYFFGAGLLLIPFLMTPFFMMSKTPIELSQKAGDTQKLQSAIIESEAKSSLPLPVGLWAYRNKKNGSILAFVVDKNNRFEFQYIIPKVVDGKKKNVVDKMIAGDIEIKNRVLQTSNFTGDVDLMPASGQFVIKHLTDKKMVLEDGNKMSSVMFDKQS